MQSLDGLLRDAATPGAAVALVVDGQPIHVTGVGHSDLGASTPLGGDAQFYVYSVTKTLLAIAVLQLVEQQRAALAAPVQTYLPALPLATPVTVRQLLNHTGGIPDYGALRAYHDALRADPSRPWTPDEFLERTLSAGLAFEPGRGWGYSNIGYLIVRQLLERAHGGPLRDILRATIFEPLGLRRTFVAESLAGAGALTPGYSALFSVDETLADIAPVYHPGWVAHGVVVSTAPELARIYEALFTGRLLGAELRAAMLAPTRVPARHPVFARPAYGLGLMLDAASPHGTVAGHGGGGPGYSSGALHLPDLGGRRVTSVALANRDQPDLGLRIAFELAQQFAALA